MLDLATIFDAASLEDDCPPYHYQLERRTLGMLRVPSGTLVASDPFLANEPFTRTVPPGAYPVELLIAWTPSTQAPDGRHELCAFARVVLGRGRVHRWELAVQPGEDPTTLARDRTFGYGVDSGTGCFADGAMFARITGDQAIADDFNQQLERAHPGIIRYAAEDGDLFGFSSGYGDGAYASWFGLDEHGAPLCLVTDFGFGDFERPQANPAPHRFAEAIAARVDALVRAVTDATWTDEQDAAARDLATCTEVGDHLARMLAVIDDATPAAFLRLTWLNAPRAAGQSAFAAWLRNAPAARAAQLLDVDERFGASDRHDLSPALASALVDLHRSGCVAIGPISRFLFLRVSALWREWPSVERLVRATLLSGTDPEVRRRGLWMAGLELAPDVSELMQALIDDPYPTVARRAVGTAIRQGRTASDLARNLSHRDLEVRATIALHLAELPAWKTLFWRAKIQSTLRDAAADSTLDPWLRRRVGAALGVN